MLDFANPNETYDAALHRFKQEGQSREDVIDFMQRHGNHVLDFDKIPKLDHNWHDQGEKISCWGAGHPMHQVWKPRKRKRL
jgi:hypothetical protein